MGFAFDPTTFDDVAFDADAPDVILVDRIDQTAQAHAPIVGSRYSVIIYADNPVAYWRLGEQSGTHAADAVGNHHGIYVNTPTLAATGALTNFNDNDDAVTFNGTNENVRVTEIDNAFDWITGPLSFEAWINHTGTFSGFGDAIIGKGTVQPYFLLDTDGALEFQSADVGDIVRGGSVTSNVWHHIVVTYNAYKVAQIYLDGSPVGGSVTYRTFTPNSTELGIASKFGTPGTDLFHGSIDEVAIYDYVLTADQVLNHYTAGSDTQFLNLGRINQTATPFAPTLVYNQSVSVGQINQTAVAHAISTGRLFYADLINQTAVAHDVHVNTFQIEAQFISNPATTFEPSIEWDKAISFTRIERAVVPFNPSLTGGVVIAPDASPATVVIRYDGTNITNDVVIVGANFTSQANGVAGTCQFKIKDPGHTYSLTTGKRLTLDINGQRVWTGYVSKVSRVYAFKAQDTSNPSLVTRFLQVDGVDINILFRKRIVFEKANPKRLFGRKYTADNTDDTVAFADLVEDFLDLSGDNLDTSTLIENVGTINVDHPANPIGVGHDWGSTMRSIISLSNGVYYIDPDRRVVLTDVDTPNAPFDLSDDPADNAVGYREMEVLYNASNMVNDCIVWGAGGGSGTMVVSREEDATSISTHGRWQYGEFRTDMYKQGTVNRRADSIVQGSAQSKRGAKDDQVTVSFVTYEPGLRVAQKIDFTSAAFGFQDVLPIRRMTVSFIGPFQPKYQITAGHEIDMPWGFFDIWRPNFDFNLPDFDFDINIPGIDIDIPDVDGDCQCNDEICGITDTFTRTVSSGWGTSDAGPTWSPINGTLSVDGDRAIAVSSGPPATAFLAVSQFDEVRFTGQIDAGGSGSQMLFFATNATGNAFIEFDFKVDGSLKLYDFSNSTGVSTTMPFGATSLTHFHLVIVADEAHLYVWEDGDTEPGSPTLSLTESGFVYATAVRSEAWLGTVGDARPAYFDDLDINGINSCSEYRFDNFNRTVSSGWGTSDSGQAWGGLPTTSVDGSTAILLNTSATASAQTLPPANPDGHVDMTMRFRAPTRTSGTNIVRVLMTVWPDGWDNTSLQNNILMFFLQSGIDGISAYREAVEAHTSFAWSLGSWYRMRVYTDLTATRIKVWLDGDAEPGSWTVENTTAYSPGDEERFLIFGNSGFTWTGTPFRVDWIDFDYEGKSCNGHSETLEVLDDFDRNITVAVDANGWGETSGTGDPWTSEVGPSFDDVSYGVESGVAIMRHDLPSGSGDSVGMMTLNEGGSDLFPFFTVGNGVPDQLFGSDEIWWAIDFLVTDIDATKTRYLEIDWADRVNRDLDGLILGIGITPTPYIFMDAFTVSGDTETLGSGFFLSDTWYTIEARRSGTILVARVYEAGSSQPNWQNSVSGIEPDVWEAGEFTIWTSIEEVATPTTEDIRFRNFRLLDTPCGHDVVTVPASGRVCEDFIGDGVTTDFFTTNTQTYGQTSVSIDGRFKTLFEYDQILNDDGNLHGVSLITPPADGAEIRVCYNVGEGLLLGLGPV